MRIEGFQKSLQYQKARYLTENPGVSGPEATIAVVGGVLFDTVEGLADSAMLGFGSSENFNLVVGLEKEKIRRMALIYGRSPLGRIFVEERTKREEAAKRRFIGN